MPRPLTKFPTKPVLPRLPTKKKDIIVASPHDNKPDLSGATKSINPRGPLPLECEIFSSPDIKLAQKQFNEWSRLFPTNGIKDAQYSYDGKKHHIVVFYYEK